MRITLSPLKKMAHHSSFLSRNKFKAPIMPKILIIGIIILCSSCSFTSRENYDPWIADEEACRELAKVDKCLKVFEASEWMQKQKETELESMFPNFLPEEAESIREAYLWIEDKYCHVPRYAEFLLYQKCKSNVILKTKPKNLPEFEQSFIDELNKELSSIFRIHNAPSIDWSELINDDYQKYQVWLISKESDPDRWNDIKITVFFDENNNRISMRLFQSESGCKEYKPYKNTVATVVENDTNVDSDFKSFIQKFTTNQSYQLSHIKFPLSSGMDKSSWDFLSSDIIFEGSKEFEGSKLQGSYKKNGNIYNYELGIVESDLLIAITFQKINSDWYLTEYTDLFYEMDDF